MPTSAPRRRLDEPGGREIRDPRHEPKHAWAGDGTRGTRRRSVRSVERERETRVYELTVLVLRREASGHNSQRSGRSGW